MKEFSLVLSGGGAKGAYQVGAFKAFLEYPIKINMVSGSSVGGINALLYATLSNSKIEELWDNFTFDDFFEEDDNPFNGLSSRDTLERLLRENIIEDKLLGAIPIFNTICVDSFTPEYKLLNNKDIDTMVKIVLATSALPVIYSTVEIEGKVYQDGGIADNLPVAPLYNLGAKEFISISLSNELRFDKYEYPVKNLIEIYPYKDLGGLFSGTLNFDKNYLDFLKEVGYKDAKRALNNFFAIPNTSDAKRDYEEALMHYRMARTTDSINNNMNYIKRFM